LPPPLPPQRINKFVELIRDGLCLALRRRVAHAEAQVTDAIAIGRGAADFPGELASGGSGLEGAVPRSKLPRISAELSAALLAGFAGSNGMMFWSLE